jgi:signal transduction histidine kinase
VLEGVAGEVSEKQKEVLGMAKANTDRPARLIHQVLDFQKLNAGKMEFKLQEHDINELMKEVCRHSQSVADKKGLALKAEVDQDLPRLKFDRDRIVEVLMNLVNNAIKFTAKGTITVRTARKGAYAEASVSDMGCGIKEEDLEKLFQRFAQLERTPGGSGLGLAISKEIVEAHKGSIRAESVFGNGSAFSFTLPI